MENISIQFESEERIIREALLRLGVSEGYVRNSLEIIKSKDPEHLIIRNRTIQELARLLKGVRSGMRPGYVHELLSKVTNLSINYIFRICLTRNPINMLKNGTKN